MSQTVVLATNTWLKMGRYFVKLAGSASTIFPDALNLDDVAGILAASNTQQPGNSTNAGKPDVISNLVLNAAVLNRQEVASGVPGIVNGNAINITYGPNGERINTDVGVPPAAPTGLIQTAAPGNTVIALTFAQQMNSATPDYKLGFSCKVAGVARVINSAALQGGNLVDQLTLASAVTTGQAVLLSYDSTVGDLKNLAGAKLQSFTDLAITNTI